MDDQNNKPLIQNDGANVREMIQMELKVIKLNNSSLDDLRKNLLALLNQSLNQKNFLKTTQVLIQMITNFWKQLEKLQNLEISSLQNNNHLLQFFENQFNSLYKLYEEINLQLNNDTHKSLLFLKEFFLIKYEIETPLNTQHPKEIQGLIKYIKNLRFKYLKLHFKLDTIKQAFLTILAQANPQELRKLQEFINLDEFLLSVINNYPKRIILVNINIEKQTIAELTNVQFTEQDFQNMLSKQKGLIEYLKFNLSIKEQMISSEELDLKLIEKELGEIFIEEPSQELLIEKIIEGLSIDELLTYVIEEKFTELRLKKEKIENFLSKLRKIKNPNNCLDQIEIEYCYKLANQTQTVIKTLETFGKRNNELFKILMQEELMNLKSQLSQFQQERRKEKDEKIDNQISNQSEEIQSQKDIIKQKEHSQVLEKEDNNVAKYNDKDITFCSNENSSTYLKYIIKVVQLKQLKLKEEMECLDKLLVEISSFSDDLDQIQRYKQETKKKCQQIFECRFLKNVKNFVQLTMTHINLQQKEDENFELYFERISSNLSKGTNDTEITQPSINIYDFLNTLKVYFQEKLAKPRYFTNTSIEQKFLIQQVRKLFLQGDLDEEYDEKSNLQLGLIDSLNEKFKDLNNNEEWKIKYGLVFTIIQISSNCFTDSIISFCQKTLIQLWISEKDQRVRNLLKNQSLINIQMQILSKDWQAQHDRIAGEMQQMLKRIDQLQEQISHEANLNERDLQLKEMDETTEQLNEYIGNVSEMGQQLRLITDFVNHIRKGLLRVEEKINQMKEQLNSMDKDIKFLRGKSVEQLLEIRKWKVLKEAAYKNLLSIYVPLKTLEKGKEEESVLMNLEQFDDEVGEVNEFLQEEKKTVLLIHGIAGSGKSTTAKKIEEFIWKQHGINKIRNQVLIPVYISLPTQKNPVFQAVEETLRQDDYGFDDLQLKECKDKLEKNEFRFLFIMDSYDEMKLENIQKNLYITNKFEENWSKPLVIFTTRTEVFTTSNYIYWFAPGDEKQLKEIEILKFNFEQKKEYLKKFTIQNIKILIFEIYEWQIQIQNQRTMNINKFEMCWVKLQQQFSKLDGSKSETLLNQKWIESILQFLKDDEFFALQSNDAVRSLSINQKKLWSIEKYHNMMRQINLDKLVETPYMMEIIVLVLPEMMTKTTDLIIIKQNFVKNFSKMFKEFLKCEYLIHLYKWQQKQHLIKLTNETEKESQQNTFVNQDKHLEINQTDVQTWKKLIIIKFPFKFGIKFQKIKFLNFQYFKNKIG